MRTSYRTIARALASATVISAAAFGAGGMGCGDQSVGQETEEVGVAQDALCGLGPNCSSGKTCCKFGTTAITFLCEDLQNDVNHCGSCSNDCVAAHPSWNAPACCTGTCKDEAADVNNCGSCGNHCAAGQICSSGACVYSCAATPSICADHGLLCNQTTHLCEQHACTNDNDCAPFGSHIRCCPDVSACVDVTASAKYCGSCFNECDCSTQAPPTYHTRCCISSSGAGTCRTANDGACVAGETPTSPTCECSPLTMYCDGHLQ